MADITEAVRKDLADYLQTQLIVDFPTVKVLRDWPVPGRNLPEYAIGITVVGAPTELPHAPYICSTTPLTATTATVLYTYARVEIQLQLDAWSTHAVKRDAFAAKLRNALNRHPADTLAVAGFPRLSRRNGIVLQLPTNYNLMCRFRFMATPVPLEDNDKAHAGEWRASWSGTAETWAAETEVVARMNTVTVKTSTNGLAPESKTTP